MIPMNQPRAQFPGVPLLPPAWRRSSVGASCVGSAGYQAPSDTLRIAAIGVGGVGAGLCRRLQEPEIVALCDLDPEFAGPVFKRFPEPGLSGISGRCSTRSRRTSTRSSSPRRSLAFSPGAGGLAMNKHIYCAKPMTRTSPRREGQGGRAGLQGHHKASLPGCAHPLCPRHHGVDVERGHRAHPRSALLDRNHSPSGLDRPKEVQRPRRHELGPCAARRRRTPTIRSTIRQLASLVGFGTGNIGDGRLPRLHIFHEELELGAPDSSPPTLARPAP